VISVPMEPCDPGSMESRPFNSLARRFSTSKEAKPSAQNLNPANVPQRSIRLPIGL